MTDIVRQIAGTTEQSARMLRAMNKRRCIATPGSLTDDRSDDIDDLAQLFFEEHQAEPERLQREGLVRMRRQFNQGIGRDSDLAASFQP